ncbi:hypothetical protein NLU14_21175 [Marinobacter sp. 71-i]|uniref:Uncharacterized protein n=1 Tax=Marinobacter iranensis TaxID=2962607 RepID=A0ABT5YGG6_9GAMM|nr:hypothetical protein [Marinobacter iranensis]MDF0752745.1 hypothetical protein [Marinobacter iranensis]
MTQCVFESLFEVAIPIVGGQQGGLVLPQVAFHHFAIFDLGDPVAQGVVAVFDGVVRGLHLLEPALAAIVVDGDVSAGGLLAQAAVAIVGVAGVALALQLVTQVVAGGNTRDASPGAGGQGAVTVVVVLVLLHQLAVPGYPRQAVAVIVLIAVLVDRAVRQGFGFTNDLANVVVGQFVVEGRSLIQLGADVSDFPVAVVAKRFVQGAVVQAYRQAVICMATDGEAVDAG